MIATRLVNDCSHYHVGSMLVAQEIRRQMTLNGMEAKEPAQLVLVNGEGTLHHDAPGAEQICNEIQHTTRGLRIALINTVWQNMSRPIPNVTFAVARETFSADAMRRDGMGAEICVAPDISLCCQHRPAYTGGRGLLVIDSVRPDISEWLQYLAARHGGRYLPMRDWKGTPTELIDLLATYDRVVTGRFHGMTLCMLAGVPFLAAPSNTWKTFGSMRDQGLAEHYHTTAESMNTAVMVRRFAQFDRHKLTIVDKQWQAIFSHIQTLCQAA
jgi:hypothetical protein